jgi:hypothetical protein
MAKKKTDFNLMVEYLINSSETFKMYLSKNSQKIYRELDSGEVLKSFFTDNKLNPSVFHVSNKIKKAHNIYWDNTDKEFTESDRFWIKYYNYESISNCKSIKRFYYIDISSAYITALMNIKLIDIDLFNTINSLPKKDRLISLGMLAYEPYEVTYINGIKTNIQRIKNEYSKTFYLACRELQLVIEMLIKKIDKRYLWYWVDGIFFENFSDFYLIKSILNSKRFKFRFGSCFDLSIKDMGNHYNLQFWQTDKGVIEFKEYNIPVYFEEIKLKKENFNHIINGNYSELINNFKKSKNYGKK